MRNVVESEVQAALVMREVICEVVYRNRGDFSVEHPARSLRIRDIPLERILDVVRASPPEKPVVEMSKEELRALAARLVDEVCP